LVTLIYRIISPPAPRPLRRLVTDSLYWTYLLTYLLSDDCLLYYGQLNPTWRLRKLNGLSNLPRSHGKFSLEFITCHVVSRNFSLHFTTCHVVSRTFHVISKSFHCTVLHYLPRSLEKLFTTLYYLPRSLENFSLHFITCHAVFYL
jgi:hypothetical protein